uniref:Uncharacterized protein n=1 Tax=Chromera velia CCMP2878 TaxID=1169474 RepID=A0A0G4F2K9_9ALVE|eukprot:Cvel_14668.t1-p1 / transcript=Cvel_14668.t1 / gene=Cvel_14668 / organism=Chromera_velia_CCMP2878 / gene_product=hypothetical protein / transcript_product=hypothetical protein / location=Cvel_scaffold1051:45402-46301(-) / protein_length=300 / sequence_SO=supercontig / SO=protein_coding / is_pseudo=false
MQEGCQELKRGLEGPEECEVEDSSFGGMKQQKEDEAEPTLTVLNSHQPFGYLDACLVCLLDLLLYSVAMWRPYMDKENLGNRTVGHYFSWLWISDLLFLLLPRLRQHWFSPFRVTEGISILCAEVSLLLLKVDCGPLWVVCATLGLSLLRVVHALCLWAKYGPHLRTHILNLPETLPSIRGPKFRGYDVSVELLLACVIPFSSSVLYMFHYNWGDPRVDGPCVGIQAGNAFNVMLKIFLFDKLMGSFAMGRRSLGLFIVFCGFALQWPLMLSMFSKALIPFVHAVAEASFLGGSLARLVL